MVVAMAVMKEPLGLFSTEPMTGFYRSRYRDVGPEDTGNHSVADTSLPPIPNPLPIR